MLEILTITQYKEVELWLRQVALIGALKLADTSNRHMQRNTHLLRFVSDRRRLRKKDKHKFIVFECRGIKKGRQLITAPEMDEIAGEIVFLSIR